MNVDIDLNTTLEGHELTIGESIVKKAAEELTEKLFVSASQEIDEIAKRVAKKRIEEFISVQVEQMFRKSFSPTDHYGNRREDKKTTLVEIIMEQTQKYLEQDVDIAGKVDTHGSGRIKRHTWIGMQIAAEAIKKELEPEIGKIKDAVKKQLAGKMTEVFHKALSEAIKFST